MTNSIPLFAGISLRVNTHRNKLKDIDGGGDNNKVCVKTIDIFYLILHARIR